MSVRGGRLEAVWPQEGGQHVAADDKGACAPKHELQHGSEPPERRRERGEQREGPKTQRQEYDVEHQPLGRSSGAEDRADPHQGARRLSGPEHKGIIKMLDEPKPAPPSGHESLGAGPLSQPALD